MGVGRRGREKANNLTIRTDARVCGRINKGDMELVEQKGNKTAEINKIGDNFDGGGGAYRLAGLLVTSAFISWGA